MVFEGTRIAAIGTLAGAIAPWLAIDLLAGMLYGVAPRAPATFAGASAALLITAVVACGLPAARAARVHPTQAIRAE